MPPTDSAINNTIYRATSFCWSNAYGIARALIAAGTFFTLAFNDIESLLYPIGRADTLEMYQSSPILKEVNLFNIFDTNEQLAKIICLIVLLTVIAGWRPRLTCLFHWWVTWSFATKAIVQDGGDQISQVLTLLLIPICLTDTRDSHWSKAAYPSTLRQKMGSILAWSTMCVIRLQIALVYFEAATAKFKVEEWSNGTSMFYWIQNPTFGVGEAMGDWVFPLFSNPWVVSLLTWGTIVFETILFMGIIMRPKQQRALMILGIGFHFAIIILFGLVSFFFAMAGALILYLGPREGFYPKIVNTPSHLKKTIFEKESQLTTS